MGKSHMYYSGTLVDKLVHRGHTVDMLVMNWNDEAKIPGSKLLRKIYNIDHPHSPYAEATHLQDPFFTGHANAFQVFGQCRILFCELLMSNTQLINQLKIENYDLALVAPFDGSGLSLAHILGINSTAIYVATSSYDYIYQGLGIPTLPSYITSVFTPIAPGRRLTFAERIESFLQFYTSSTEWFNEEVRNSEHPIITKYYPDTPRYTQLFKNVSYVFLNMPELLDIGRPISSKIKFIGGIHVEDDLKKDKKALPEEYEQILSSHPKGTVIFSLGSQIMMHTVPIQIRDAMIKAFSHFPEYSFIWKHDKPEEMSNLNVTNVFFKKWLPQKELLADSRIRCFITHMGLNSYAELAFAGVSTIMIPLFADQEFNAGVAESKNLGITLDKKKITYETLKEALTKVLTDPQYDTTAKMYAKMLRTQPFSPSETFVKYVEYAIENPRISDVIQLKSAYMGWSEMYSYDVLGLYAATAVLGYICQKDPFLP
ncbi:unnamed protein product [Bursaphelenchus okinawaensis]|uniref:glucuronosyltransferase n=1 Tax=Bursaphelenchus okinawaensis TaxID=465554 RepID=A0A811K200_9BILA|nr:unnamed protein product [Bursaphelenchus okinawaensis]CAG9090401.1 unnamed protein product [Bursaphelenchus okinawaensis]